MPFSWIEGTFGCSADVLDGLVCLSVTGRSRGPVVIDGITYSASDIRAYETPDNVEWIAKLHGRASLKIGTFATKTEAKEACRSKMVDYGAEIVEFLGKVA